MTEKMDWHQQFAQDFFDGKGKKCQVVLKANRVEMTLLKGARAKIGNATVVSEGDEGFAVLDSPFSAGFYSCRGLGSDTTGIDGFLISHEEIRS